MMISYRVFDPAAKAPLIIALPYDLCRDAFEVTFTTRDGRVVPALREPHQDAARMAAYRSWRDA